MIRNGVPRACACSMPHTKRTTNTSREWCSLCLDTRFHRLLLNSRSSRFPMASATTAASSGHYLMDHHNGGGPRLVFSLGRYYRGRVRPACTSALPQRRLTARETSRAAMDTVYTSRQNWTRGLETADFGAAFKNEIARPASGRSIWRATARPSLQDNRVWLDPIGRIRAAYPSTYP